MSVTRLRRPSQPLIQSIAATGTTALNKPLAAGLYRIATDTTQSLSAVQLVFQTAGGHAFGAVVRGGLGYVAFPSTVETVALSAGTFPVVLEIELLSYTLADAPTVTAFDWSSASGNGGATVTVTNPGGGALRIYWENGTTSDYGTGPIITITMPTATTLGDTSTFLLVGADARGVYGLATEYTTPYYPFVIFTSSDTYTAPAWSSTADVLVVGGGGGAGAASGSSATSGGGGGGEALTATGVSTLSPVSFVIGAGGTRGVRTSATGVTNATEGGSSSFGALTALGGNTSTSQGGSGSTPSAGGSSGAGFAGGGTDSFASGGGGGATAVGSKGSYNGGNTIGGAGGAGLTHFGVAVGGGGGGGATSTRGLGADGGGNAASFNGGAGTRGGGGGGTKGGSGGDGGAGYLIIKAIED